MADESQYYPKHECGIFGIFGHPDAALLTYYGLYALQHRGQESAGITVSTDGQDFRTVKGMGLVPQIFDDEKLKNLKGNRAIGHVRYSTTGSSHIINAQPIVVNCAQGQVAVGHNGNLINANELREELEAKGSIFQTTVDSEIILHLMAQPRSASHDNSLIYALKRIQGAYSLVIQSEKEIIGVRDPHGFRPLCIGKLGDAWVLSSETCAFDLIQAEFVRDVEPGEIVIIDENGLRSLKPFVPPEQNAFCIFEYVYFARPDSNIHNVNVSATRFRMGIELARLHPVDADVVIPVPDSGNYAAMGYSEQSKIPFEQAFVRNHYVGRTFIQPTQLIRDFGVRVKLNLIKSAVKGKRVIVVDDSIVRGTTARARVVNLREAGAKEVHVRVSCPPHRFPCHYGIDFPNRSELLANKFTNAQIAEYLGADSVGYLDVTGMIRATTHKPNQFCLACFTGDYPIKYNAETDKFIMERRKQRPPTELVPHEEQTRLL
ncbi:amidophosphoribosyltransferase [Kamptonema cortianum]|nr:amidophosphoribosyltransferase [Oscillatoria laete-virens]MDK3160321.1 amidophosphoribosyltransferase [Kamptonema cortianum]MDL5053704.1 amidophosphoribosyltransferase [Oscillatoria laete-virens NRMC-F 0139]